MPGWPYNTRAWKRLRLVKLSASPVCEVCARRGVVEAARVVDHNTAINAGGDPFPPLDGLTAMCVPCHNSKTAAVDRKTALPFARRIKGFDADGNPLDDTDEWHTGGGGGQNHQNGKARIPTGNQNFHLVSSRKLDETSDNVDDLGFA
ncbi:HNH endonuclease [Pannonibacter tanglangensis]|uniref:HNH endonuclease n=1 Tax=Pannonibacter tanglangensis TaxID=2750084 RepID=UPI0015D3055C|nr:HNH endonuclease [Pannonibacter sp. XCT-53]